MRIAITGATGFLGRYLVKELVAGGHTCRCWHRPTSRRAGLESEAVTWVPGSLETPESFAPLVEDCDAVIHAALDRPEKRFRGAEGDLVTFATRNIVGSLRLVETARAAGVPRFIFISTCAVHEQILDDRPLDETHPTWARSHYGAHKAAIEQFVYSFGLGHGYDICALRPTGIYGRAEPVAESKWVSLIEQVARGETIDDPSGGKEVHVADVARAAHLLLTAPDVAGQVYNCYDQYVAAQDVAQIARDRLGSASVIQDRRKTPRHQIRTEKLRALGMQFGGRPLLEATVADLAEAVTA